MRILPRPVCRFLGKDPPSHRNDQETSRGPQCRKWGNPREAARVLVAALRLGGAHLLARCSGSGVLPDYWIEGPASPHLQVNARPRGTTALPLESPSHSGPTGRAGRVVSLVWTPLSTTPNKVPKRYNVLGL
ncbi:hypothetical protein NDU88_001966 [Pleurodeles waltl]|uniref:Uncharacterized protein n=1 Tax=Pleurodeles waltl TaxID=8319 RepID=A0AAV7S933_PLEWA|nr:hypothetical protein NDU88_001966 [Pleurodeles waltl]